MIKKKYGLLIIIIFMMSTIIGEFPKTYVIATENVDVSIPIKKNQYVEDNYNVIFNITDKWENFYNAEIIINNISDTDIENWEISFKLADKISDIWCAKIVEHTGDIYVIKNLGWNQDIKSNNSIRFGFTVKYENDISKPSQYSMTRVCQQVKSDYKINYKINNKWENGCIGTIIIKNNSDYEIEDWKISFDTDLNFNSIWNAQISEYVNGKYYVNNLGYNSNIKPHEIIEIGFEANYSDTIDIKHFLLYNMDILIQENIDTDCDGLTDSYEYNVSKTSANCKDSDGDGLDDYYELNKSITDPKINDTDGNGVPDGDEDFDGDGLKNIDEYNIGTNPYSEDTDNDLLSDYEEYITYKTDPLVDDTDNDGLIDGDEIKLKLNPLSKDSDNNGINDSLELINQTKIYNEFDKNSPIINMFLTTKISGDINNSYFIYENEGVMECVSGKLCNEICVDNITNTSANIQFKIDTSKLNCDINDLLILEYHNGFYKLLDTKIDNDKKLLSATIMESNATYCIVNNLEYENNEKMRYAVKSKSKNYSEKQLKNDIKRLVKKDVSLNIVRTYSSDQAINIILKYNDKITSASKTYGINKALIQAVLLRELTCLNVSDDVADSAVISYYSYKQQLENYNKLPWYKQIIFGPPVVPVPIREDSSTGLGQIFAKTGINARNATLQKGESKMNYSNWKQRKSMWYRLKDNNAYNITMVARVLKMEKYKLAPSSRSTILILSRYNNGNAKKATTYGNICYRYYNLFNKYNG